MNLQHRLAGIAAAAMTLSAGSLPAADGSETCLPGGEGRFAMTVSGAFEARIDWDGAGTRCDGGPRPRGDALRLMFSRADDALLVVVGITGLQRGGVAEALPANLTIVREGLGEFYGTLGTDACTVEVTENQAIPGLVDSWRIGGRGHCSRPVEAIAREGELEVGPFVFSGKAHWPDEED